MGKLEGQIPGKMLLVVLKSIGDRYINLPHWAMTRARQMVSTSGFKIVSLDEGRQILVVAEKTAARQANLL